MDELRIASKIADVGDVTLVEPVESKPSKKRQTRPMKEAEIASRLARSLNAYSPGEDWEKGYNYGVAAASALEWGIAEVIMAAVVAAQKSGVPELKRITRAMMNTERKWIDEMPPANKADAADAGAKMLQKARRHGPMGIAGAMAGATEDANAHKAAGIVYGLAEDLKKKYSGGGGVKPEQVKDFERAVKAMRGVVIDLKKTVDLLKGGDEIALPMVKASLRRLKDLNAYTNGIEGTLLDIQRGLGG